MAYDLVSSDLTICWLIHHCTAHTTRTGRLMSYVRSFVSLSIMLLLCAAGSLAVASRLEARGQGLGGEGGIEGRGEESKG